MWEAGTGDSVQDVLLPLSRHLGDYALRMAETVAALADREERSQLEALADLQTAGTDVVRFRFRDATAADGSIPLDRGEALVENAREMMLAGACAAVHRRPYFGSRRPAEVNQFMNGLRLGQTERGSYVLTVYSKVVPRLVAQPELFGEPEAPFGRQAVTRLARALAALRAAADESMTTDDARAFTKAVEAGVSGNLCSAVVGMAGTASQPADELRIAFTYARSRPVAPDTPREIVIPGDCVGIIAGAAGLYKASAPPEATEVRGIVVKLQQDGEDDSRPTTATLHTVLDGRTRKVQIVLDSATAATAVRAFADRSEVACTGVLAKQGAGWVLTDLRGFDISAGE